MQLGIAATASESDWQHADRCFFGIRRRACDVHSQGAVKGGVGDSPEGAGRAGRAGQRSALLPLGRKSRAGCDRRDLPEFSDDEEALVKDQKNER